jgi:hypothetical protein
VSFLFPKLFPFCIPPAEDTVGIAVGTGTYYPFAMTLEDVMALYWKSKTFHCVINLSAQKTRVSISATQIFGATFNTTIEADYNERDPEDWPQKMSDMICRAKHSQFGNTTETGLSYVFYNDELLYSNVGRVRILLFTDGVSDSNPIITRNNRYYPKISILAVGGEGREDIYVFFTSYVPVAPFIPANVPYVSNALQFNINNNQYMTDIYCTMIYQNYDDPLVPDPGTLSASFVITGNNDRLTE